MKGYFAGYDRETGEAIVYWDLANLAQIGAARSGQFDATGLCQCKTRHFTETVRRLFHSRADGKGGFR